MQKNMMKVTKEMDEDRKFLILLAIWIIACLTFSLIMYLCIGTASADTFTDIKHAVADTFETDSVTAGYLLTAMILGAIIISLTIMRVNIFAEVVVLFVVLAFCTIVGWIGFWVLIVVSLVLVLMFSSKIREVFTGGGGAD